MIVAIITVSLYALGLLVAMAALVDHIIKSEAIKGLIFTIISLALGNGFSCFSIFKLYEYGTPTSLVLGLVLGGVVLVLNVICFFLLAHFYNTFIKKTSNP